MRGTGRLIYDVVFIAVVAALAYKYSDLYHQTESTLEPYLQAYTTVGLILIVLTLLFLLNYLREAIASTFVALMNSPGRGGKDGGEHSANILRTAKKQLRKGDFHAAGEAYESLEMWRDAAVTYEKGNYFTRAANAWQREGDITRAIELYERDGNFDTAATLCFQEGLPDRARRNYNRAAEHSLESNQIVQAAEFYEKAEDFARAAALFEQSHKLDRALIAYERMENADKILQILRAMPPADFIRRGHKFTELVERCAEVLNRNGYSLDAAEILEQAHAYTRAAEIYAENNRAERAAELYLQADQPAMAETVIAKIKQPEVAAEISARLALRRGDFLAAARHFEECGKKTQAVDAYKKGKDFESAARVYEELERYILAGEMYSSARNFPAAANAFAKAYDWRNAAECFEEANDIPHAIEAYANAGSYLKAGKLALKLTDYARAVEYLQRIPPGSPDEIAGTAFLATAFYYQTHNDMAYELFSKSMDSLPLNRDTLPAWYAWAHYLEKYEPKQSLTFFRQIMGVDVHYSDVADRVQKLEQVITSMTRESKHREPTPPYMQQARPEFTPTPSMAPPVGHTNSFANTPATSVQSQQLANPATLSTHRRPTPSTTQYPLVAARYQIQAPSQNLGRVVDYIAHDTQTNTAVSLRLFPRPADPAIEEATRELLRNAERMSHPGLSKILRYGDDADMIYVVSESPIGETLQHTIRTSGPMSVEQARTFFLQILNGLEYAHSQDVCHLNLRPEVIIKNAHETAQYLICGFGIPVRQPQDSQTMYATSPDTDPQYMAPEQIVGHDIDNRTDIYALGLLLFYVLTGRTPFEARRVQDTQEIARMQVQSSLARPSTLRATLPTIVDEIFLKCVYKSPTSRYQSIEELIDDISRLQATPITG